MQVILKMNVPNLGALGDVVKVKDGYARNYLIPRGFAVRYTEGQLKSIEMEKKSRAHKLEAERKKARGLCDSLQSIDFTIRVKAGDGGRLFGSVTTAIISDLFRQNGYNIDKRDVTIPQMIKEVGKHKVSVRLHEDIVADISILVEGS